MSQSLGQKIKAARTSAGLLRRAVLDEFDSRALATAESMAEAAYESVVTHQCADTGELLEKLRFLFDEASRLAEHEREVVRLLDLALADVTAALKARAR